MTVAESAFALSARRYFAFSSGESSLFHLVNRKRFYFMQSKPNQLNEPDQSFCEYNLLFFLHLKCLLNEFKNKKCCIHV